MNALGLQPSAATSYLNAEELDAISRLARGTVAPAGLRLAEMAADLLDGRLGERERTLICDVLLRLVCKAQEELRQAISTRLAPNPNAPRDLVLFLANDVISVARPLLLGSEALTDLDLVHIVQRRSDLHGRSIALRTTVSEAVGESLAARGDGPSMAFLLQNTGARISLAAALSLAEAARTVAKLQQLLLHRLSPEMARELYWHVPMELRREIRSRFDIEPSEMEGGTQQSYQPRLAYVDGSWVAS